MSTTIKELNSNLKERGMLSEEKLKKSKTMKLGEFFKKDKDNSMLKSDIDINEDRDNVIMELDDDEEVDKT